MDVRHLVEKASTERTDKGQEACRELWQQCQWAARETQWRPWVAVRSGWLLRWGEKQFTTWAGIRFSNCACETDSPGLHPRLSDSGGHGQSLTWGIVSWGKEWGPGRWEKDCLPHPGWPASPGGLLCWFYHLPPPSPLKVYEFEELADLLQCEMKAQM